jgi:hypothetical protein
MPLHGAGDWGLERSGPPSACGGTGLRAIALTNTNDLKYNALRVLRPRPRAGRNLAIGHRFVERPFYLASEHHRDACRPEGCTYSWRSHRPNVYQRSASTIGSVQDSGVESRRSANRTSFFRCPSVVVPTLCSESVQTGSDEYIPRRHAMRRFI